MAYLPRIGNEDGGYCRCLSLLHTAPLSVSIYFTMMLEYIIFLGGNVERFDLNEDFSFKRNLTSEAE